MREASEWPRLRFPICGYRPSLGMCPTGPRGVSTHAVALSTPIALSAQSHGSPTHPMWLSSAPGRSSSARGEQALHTGGEQAPPEASKPRLRRTSLAMPVAVPRCHGDINNSVWCPRNSFQYGVPGIPSVWCPRNYDVPGIRANSVLQETSTGLEYSRQYGDLPR
jgi:hypothetical protein